MPRWPRMVQSLLLSLKRLGTRHQAMQPVVGKIAEIKGSQVDPRFEPCDLLLQARIPCKIWGEDVLSFYGVPTVVFDLFILVSNPNEASQSLINQGYSLSTPNPRFAHIPELSHRVSRLVPSVLADKTTRTSSLSSSDGLGLVEADDTVLTGVVLLSASDWNYPLPDSVTGLQELVPSLHEYFDCIVEKWMDLPKDSDDLRDHLAIHIGYHSLYLDEVWTEDFEKQVRKEHRQFLFDLLADGAAGRVDLLHSECQVYHRDIKGRILEGNHEPVIHDKFVRERVGPVNVGSRFELTVP